MLGRGFLIQTDYQALKWLFNVKDPSSRLVRWRLRLEEYRYKIEYKKGKESKIVLNETNSERLPYEDNEPIAVRLRKKKSNDEEKIFEEYCTWKSNRPPLKIKSKPTTNGKNWIKISKQNIFLVLRIQVPDFNEEIWMKLLYHIVTLFSSDHMGSGRKYEIN